MSGSEPESLVEAVRVGAAALGGRLELSGTALPRRGDRRFAHAF
ncbi:hypothetical protein FHR84_004411 [Actinopolyspora biskrensis]|uniref:Uncharacterized protein n=1 Tax=Actinopolyspora biskrensis TaxID=1470178 RepID=A0A852ZE70_9ACTN|nr:hypothetical protein [Actinopolyspora biskrensis]NYH81037.1 hypothetical protein [Actinopolyspora biskrensis]